MKRALRCPYSHYCLICFPAGENYTIPKVAATPNETPSIPSPLPILAVVYLANPPIDPIQHSEAAR